MKTLALGRALGVREDLALQSQTASRLEVLATYPLDHVRERLLAKKLVPVDKVEEAIGEYRRYLALILMGFGQVAMSSRVVDEVWHAHILFTHDYMTFCDTVFNRYIHHEPSTKEKPVTADRSSRLRDNKRPPWTRIPPEITSTGVSLEYYLVIH